MIPKKGVMAFINANYIKKLNKEENYMKKLVKKYSRLVLVAILGVMLFALTGCTAVQISASVDLNEDGSGSRTITASIAKKDLQDGYGSAYYYLKQHGDKLEKYLKSAYASKVPGSDKWLKVSVNDSGADWEVINLTFDFKSFDDYKTKLASLAYDKEAAATYAEPKLTVKDDGTATYSENAAALTAIFKSIQKTMMDDKAMFDINCTKDGKALNDGSADLKSLQDFGVEMMKPENGDAMTIKLGSGKAAAIEAKDGLYTVTGKYEAKAATEVKEDTADEAAESAAADTAAETSASDTASESDLPKTGDSIMLAVISVIGLVSCAAVLMTSKKLKTQNR
jgi:hypothetical protein